MTEREWNPRALLELSGSYWQTCALHAGVKLDVFSAIGKSPSSAEKIAQTVDADPRGLGMLLNALAAMHLLEKKDGLYTNTQASLEYLTKSSPRYLGFMIMHHHHLMESWAHLDESVKTGAPLRRRSFRNDEQWRESFLMGMFNMAMQQAPKLVGRIDASTHRRMLDLGGGPGTYAIHFCKQNPQLEAVVYDLPTTRPFAERTIQRFGLSDRIVFKDIDYLNQGIDGTFDLVWMSHILHGESPEKCRRIIDKAVSALEPGGLILIHEFILNRAMDGPLFAALFSLNMLLGTEGGQAYSEDQIAGMLAHAGVKNIRRIPIESPTDSGIMAGNK